MIYSEKNDRLAEINTELQDLSAQHEQLLVQIDADSEILAPQRHSELEEKVKRVAKREFELRQERYRLLGETLK